MASDIYPLVIIADRYEGVYSGGRYTAWNHYIDDIPLAIDGDDIPCLNFWRNSVKQYKIGVGATINEAVENLRNTCLSDTDKE